MEEYDDDDFYDDDLDCFHCGGEGFIEGSEMGDPMWYDDDEWYKCFSCGGSGNRADMTVC